MSGSKTKGERARVSEFDMLMNVMLLGESGVGKTSLMRKYVNNEYNDQKLATIGSFSSHLREGDTRFRHRF
jgi:GTPase SAR1 family protein